MTPRITVEHTSSATAEFLLRRLALRFGDAGLDAAARVPGLLAAVDQHAADIRDTFGDAARPGPVELASYADGLTDTAAELGWTPPQPGAVDWSRVDGVTLRLLAICALARSGDRPA